MLPIKLIPKLYQMHILMKNVAENSIWYTEQNASLRKLGGDARVIMTVVMVYSNFN